MLFFIRLALVMVSVHSSKTVTLTNIEVGTREWGVAMIALTMLLFERMWIFGLWIWNSVECFKWGLMGHLVEIWTSLLLGVI